MANTHSSDNSSSNTPTLILVGFGIPFIFMVFVVFFYGIGERPTLKPVQLATGEWPPYTGEELPSYGVATAIVSEVMHDIGYEPHYQFMSWPVAIDRAESSKTDDEIRGSFPFIDSKERHELYFISDAIMHYESTAFYNTRTNKAAEKINETSDLSGFSILKIEGYEYPESIRSYIKKFGVTVPDTEAAFRFIANSNRKFVIFESKDFIDKKLKEEKEEEEKKKTAREKEKVKLEDLLSGVTSSPLENKEGFHAYYNTNDGLTTNHNALSISDFPDYTLLLVEGHSYPEEIVKHFSENSLMVSDIYSALQVIANPQQKYVVVESLEVGNQLLEQKLQKMMSTIKTAPLQHTTSLHLLLSKNNPNNRTLIDDFNRSLKRLTEHPGAFLAFQNGIKHKINMSRAVQLEPFNKEGIILAYTNKNKEESVLLPRGSRAIVKQWATNYFEKTPEPRSKEISLVQVKLLNGPMKNDEFFVDARTINLP